MWKCAMNLKSHIARYSAEFHRVWGLPNPDVDNLPLLLEYSAVSLKYHITMFIFIECGVYPTPMGTTFNRCSNILR